jgi:hypothetical protein
MKLNYDCVRSVLLTVEKSKTIDEELNLNPLTVETIFEQLPKYEDNEILYTIEKLKEAGYINAALHFAAGHFIDGAVSSITYSGHEYLDNIREPEVWRKVKAMLKNAGATTLPLISQAAQMLIGSQLTVN